MDLSKFKESSRLTSTAGNAKKTNFLTRNYTRVKYWVYPPTTERRKERFSQYKDFSIFLGAVIAVAVFEDKIKSFLEIETDDLKKMATQGAF